MRCWNFSSFVDRVTGSPQDTPLAFAITVVMRVTDSTSQIRTRVNKDVQSDLDTWCGKKMTPNTPQEQYLALDFLIVLGCCSHCYFFSILFQKVVIL